VKDNPLLEYFNANNQHIIHKWEHYFEIYHRHFFTFRGLKPTVVEFGIGEGGSLKMWKNYGSSGRCRDSYVSQQL
jgi:hypothetical protein